MRPAGAPSACGRILLAAILLLDAPAIARADDGGSEKYVQRGIDLRRVGRDQEALDAFQHAYAIDPTPRVSAQIGFAHQALGDWVDAERGIEEALRAADDPWIARYRDVLTQALATVRRHIGTLYLEANVGQGELFLNALPSEPMPSPDQPLRVPAGTSQFELRAPGYAAMRRTVEVPAGAEVHVVVTLEPIAAPQPTFASVAALTPIAEDHRPTPQARTPDVLQATARRSAQHTTWAYVAFAAAGALAGAGTVAWRVREYNVGIFNDDSRCEIGSLTRGQRCGSYERAANIAFGFEIGTFVAAAGSAAAGAWLLWGPQARSARVSATCAPWSTFGVACSARF